MKKLIVILLIALTVSSCFATGVNWMFTTGQWFNEYDSCKYVTFIEDGKVKTYLTSSILEIEEDSWFLCFTLSTIDKSSGQYENKNIVVHKSAVTPGEDFLKSENQFIFYKLY